jgi:hypothetical protein
MPIDDEYTVSLLHLDGTDASSTFTDESGKAWTRQGDAQIDTAQSQFGGASGLFDGAGDYVGTPNSSDFNFGTADWTIDCWLRRNGTKSYPGVFTTVNSGATGVSFGLGNSTNKVRVYWNSAQRIATTGTIADLTWTHVAVVRYGNTVKVYINGVADVTTGDCTGFNFDSAGVGANIGRYNMGEANYYWNGWIDELRVSKGIARWTSTFTPPTVAYYPTVGTPASVTPNMMV